MLTASDARSLHEQAFQEIRDEATKWMPSFMAEIEREIASRVRMNVCWCRIQFEDVRSHWLADVLAAMAKTELQSRGFDVALTGHGTLSEMRVSW